MDYNEKQKIERDCFNSLVHEKWDDKSLFIDKEKPPFANYSGDLLDGTKKFLKDVTGKKVLEIGCGNGELSVWMAKNGADVFGVDISDESIKIAERRSAENATQNNTHFYARPAE
ncbi:methyltransferase domain-containing protein [Patescibacteria group bacterium]|nr:methyltransferase domain-containing protein [Patescibacteria group bacterium]MBU2250118.1 methyltransferase domain-containing protein [Patescibacteria group bacterium]